ncbi:MAG: OmpA family protein [Alphaproteobacteria bacterium]
MKKSLIYSISYVSLCIGLALAPVSAARAGQEMGSLVYYPVSQEEIRNNYLAWSVFMEYNQNREPCQHYVDPPAGYVLKGCDVFRVEKLAMAEIQGPPAPATIEPAAGEAILPPSIVSVYFDWDKYNIRPDQREKLDSAISDIVQAHPSLVIVAGHTDTSGPAAYNMRLSERRAQTVTNAMIAQGVNPDVIDQKAYGETDLAVPTADGVRLEENRRTVIQYSITPGNSVTEPGS